MKRRLLNLATLLALLLCAAVVATWVRSYRHWDVLGQYWFDPQSGIMHRHELSSVSGAFVLFQFDETDTDAADAAGWAEQHRGYGAVPRWVYARRPAGQYQSPRDTPSQKLGFDWVIERDVPMTGTSLVDSTVRIRVPHWLLAIALAALPAWRAVGQWRRRHRRRRGACARCGYDLRASGDRCPECGTAVPQAAHTAVRSADG